MRTALLKIRGTKKTPGFWLMERDLAILKAVYRYRMMVRRQIENLLFSSTAGQNTNTDRARERLRLLCIHNFLRRIPRQANPWEGSKPPVYRLGPETVKRLAEPVGISPNGSAYWGRSDDRKGRRVRVKELFLNHGLAMTDVRIAIDQSVAINEFSIESERDDFDFKLAQDWDYVKVELPSGGKERIRISPDYYFALRTPLGKGYFFVEVDRSTETVSKTWQRKILGYKKYISSAGFHRHNKTTPQTMPRILTTTPSQKRAQNLKKAAEKYGSPEMARRFLFAAISEVTSQDLFTSSIWLRAGDEGMHSIV